MQKLQIASGLFAYKALTSSMRGQDLSVIAYLGVFYGPKCNLNLNLPILAKITEIVFN